MARDLWRLLALLRPYRRTVAGGEYLHGVLKYHQERLGERVLADLRRDLFRGFLAQPLPFFESNPPGRLQALAVNEVDNLRDILRALFFGFCTLVGILAIFAFCFAVDARLAVFLLFPPLLLAVLARLDRWMRARNEIALERQEKLISFLKLRLSHVGTIQAFGREAAEEEKLAGLAGELAEARARTEILAQASKKIFGFFRYLTLGGILLFGGVRLIRHRDLSLGALMAVYEYAWILFEELEDLFGYFIRARLASVSLRRILDAHDRAPAMRGGTAVGRLEGRIEFRDVSFRYDPHRPWALRHASFVIQPGERVAIVGRSGAGKTTIFRLLFRFYDPVEGEIFVGGHDVRSLDLASLRRQIGLAAQEAVLFDDTIAENILYGREGATPAQLDAAIETASAGFVRQLPQGLATRVGEGGVELSGGQRHRIALARVVLKDAPIVLLDEISADLDPVTEQEVYGAIERTCAGRTTLMIAHSVWAMTRSNRILVLDRGTVAQDGRHEDLFPLEGPYRSLFERRHHSETQRRMRETSSPA